MRRNKNADNTRQNPIIACRLHTVFFFNVKIVELVFSSRSVNFSCLPFIVTSNPQVQLTFTVSRVSKSGMLSASSCSPSGFSDNYECPVLIRLPFVLSPELKMGFFQSQGNKWKTSLLVVLLVESDYPLQSSFRQRDTERPNKSTDSSHHNPS